MKTSVKIIVTIVILFGIFYFKDDIIKTFTEPAKKTNVKQVIIAGGVAANKGLRTRMQLEMDKLNIPLIVPQFKYCTDNAAMIGVVGYYKFLNKEFCAIDVPAFSKVTFQ